MTATSVIVGMSGGVDSSVAAQLLLREGYAVSGLFMKNWEEDDGTEYCTALTDLEDARQVADRLGIPLHTANFSAEYWDGVFEQFLSGYAAGRTPNPDVLCNREIKFKQFADYALTLGADYIATGHYVRREGTSAEGNFRLLKGSDQNKDQSYFLQAVPAIALARCLFPLGNLKKSEVRKLAAEAHFANHRKKDSTGICFIGERRFRDFLKTYIPAAPGPIVDPEGVTIGEHSGLAYYTLGQRTGLGIGGLKGRPEAPWYVAGKQLAGNRLIATQNSADLESEWLAMDEVNWLVPQQPYPIRCTTRIRYRQVDQQAVVTPRADGTLGLRFSLPQRAVTPGQYACLYQGDVCIGGGRIVSAGLPS